MIVIVLVIVKVIVIAIAIVMVMLTYCETSQQPLPALLSNNSPWLF